LHVAGDQLAVVAHSLCRQVSGGGPDAVAELISRPEVEPDDASSRRLLADHRQDGAAEIDQVLAARHRHTASAETDFLVQNRKSLIDTQLAAFARLTFLVKWIAASALLVSSLGVFAVTWIGIRNRTREIGTRRAIGATRSDILLQFFAEGTLGAVLGGAAGIVAGNIALRAIGARLSQPFVFSTTASLFEVLASVTLYSTFTFISSLRAIRIQPLVALRAE
jgi:putative ABC transport system permease protein